MASMKCPACGGRCDFEFGKGYVCDYCGNVYNGSENSDSVTDKLNYANAKRIEDYDFEGALRLCHEVLEEKPENQEANWCALLAEYQIIYLQNDEGKYVPTFLNPEVETPLNKCGYYAKLNGSYRQMADNIERMRALVVREARDIPDYDVFISYRQHVGKSSSMETEESLWADEFYRLLSKQTGNDKLRVFYDKASLDSSNAGWEPHIHAALSSAKFLVLMGSSIDNINSTWVKNEWKRFTAYRQMGKEKTIAVLAKNIDPVKLPDIALRTGQMIKADEKGWQKKLVKRANDACKENKDVPYLLNEAETFIQKRKFKRAKQTYLKVCSLEPRNSKAYWGLLKCRLKAMDDYDLIKSRKKFVKINEYNDAVRYAVGKEKEHYMQICNAQLTHNTNGYERTNYNIWKKKSRVQWFFKKVAIIAAVLLVCAFGVYSYFGITQPVHYEINDGKATLSGKSIYFNFVVSDLELDTYKDYPVVKIDDGALKNSSLKSVSMSEAVEIIGDNAFYGSSKLTSVTVAYSNLSIGAYAFANCTSLETVSFENCTYLGGNAFNACTKLAELKIGITDETVIEAGAFSNIGRSVIVYVPTIAENIAAQLRSEYPTVNFVTYTREKVEECTYFIDKLGSVSYDSGADIRKAENLYNDLSSEEKTQITNYGVLQNARASYNAAVAINSIGEITLESENDIIEAENIYSSLTAEQKKAVANYSILTTARAVYDTMYLIDSIGEVQINSEPKIVKAEEAYLALSYEQRDLVTNYPVLTSARTNVDILLANAVIEKIREIDSVITLDSESKITAAESAYNSLTDGQKNRVSNYDTLTDARAVYNVIKAIDNIGTITVNSGSIIAVAQTLYDGLTSAQKLKILNYSTLTDANVVYSVVAQIGAIGSVSSDSLTSIETAEAAYDNLTATQQTKVSNYSTLTNSRTVYSTVLLIDEIESNITENSGPAIEAAQNSYNGLSSTQKNLVGNYSKLSDASKVYYTIVAINAIGDVSLNSSSKISTAETYYSALTSAQKEMITNYETLVSARAIYNVMSVVSTQGTVRLGKGTNYSYQTLSTSNMETILNNSTIRNEIDSITLTGLVTLSNQSYWTSAFKNLSLVRYDVTSGTSLSSFSFTPSKLTYRVVGSTSTYNIALTASSGDILNLEFESFNYKSSTVALDLTKVSTTFLTFIGTCSIESGNGFDAIDAKDLNIALLGTGTTIKAGNGNADASGGIGIKATLLNITSNNSTTVSMFTVVGGNGGNSTKTGTNGANAAAVTSHRVGNDGGNGGAGGAGIDGSAAVTAYSVCIDIGASNSLTFIGGNGGAGAKGGTGGNGSQACETNINAGHTGDSLRGGYGGIGGTGGNGGAGGTAVIVTSSISVNSGKCLLQGGVGGAGGTGGTGGTGGKGGNNTIWFTGGGRGGTGGNGGNGGNGGTGGNRCNKTVNKTSSALLTQNDGSVGAKGLGGAGGAGGAGGNGTTSTGAKGADGNTGANGTGTGA